MTYAGVEEVEDKDYKIEFGQIYLSKPTFSEADGETATLYPMQARLRNLTCALWGMSRWTQAGMVDAFIILAGTRRPCTSTSPALSRHPRPAGRLRWRWRNTPRCPSVRWDFRIHL